MLLFSHASFLVEQWGGSVERPMKLSLHPMAGSVVTTASSQRACHGQKRFVQPAERSRKYLLEWTTSLRSKRRILCCSPAPSASSRRNPRSCLPIWLAICSARPFTNAELSQDSCVQKQGLDIKAALLASTSKPNATILRVKREHASPQFKING